MTEKEYRAYRFNDKTDPTDDQLAFLMEKAAEEVRLKRAEAHNKYFEELRKVAEEAKERGRSHNKQI